MKVGIMELGLMQAKACAYLGHQCIPH